MSVNRRFEHNNGRRRALDDTSSVNVRVNVQFQSMKLQSWHGGIITK